MSNILIKQEDFKFEINSSVKSVTIFSDRAEVTRTKKVNVKNGIQSITFLNLGNNIDKNTIRAKINKNNLKILSNSMEINNLYFFKEKENQTTFEELIEILKEFIRLEDEKQIAQLENCVIYDLRDYLQLSLNELILDSDNSLTKLKEALTFLEENINENSNTTNQIDDNLRNLKEKLDIYKIKLAEIRNMDKRVQNNIIVTIESGEECEVEIEISYILTGVNWKSTYDATLDTEKSKVTFSYYGEVMQSTGEEWNDCYFILSTSIVDTNIEIPKIFPVTLSGYAEKREKNIKVTEAVYKELEESDGLIAGASPPELEPAPDMRIASQKKGVSHSFTIEKPGTIVSDGQYHKLLIVKTDFECELFYESLPEIMEYIYLKANIKNNLSIPLLPGSIMIYRNGSFMGRSQFKYIAPNENFSLSFGIDDDLRIKRVVYLNRFIEPSTVFSKKQREYKFVYVLNNYKNDDISVIIKESIHKSEIKEIVVDMKEDSTAGYEMNNESIVSWVVLVGKDSFKPAEVILHYIISSPKSFPLENI